MQTVVQKQGCSNFDLKEGLDSRSKIGPEKIESNVGEREQARDQQTERDRESKIERERDRKIWKETNKKI